MSAAGFDPDQLRESLRPLTLGGQPLGATPQQQAYLDHYRIGLDAEYADLRQHMGYLGTPDHEIAVQCWQPSAPRGTVVIVHGYFDHVGLYGHLIRHLLDQRLAVLGFDLPGHGLSTGEPATIDTFDHYVSALDVCLGSVFEHLPEPWHVAGQSTGGAIAMQWLMGHGHTKATSPLQKVVLLAPLVRPYGWWFNRFVYLAAKRFVSERPRKFASNSEDPEFLRFLRDHDPLQSRVLPVQWVASMVAWKQRFLRYDPCDIQPLVVQGKQDRTVDWRYNLRIIGRLFRPRIVLLPPARHQLVNESAEIRAQVFAAITEELA